MAALIGLQGQAHATSILLTAEDFAVLASSEITNTGPTTIRGDVGLYPGTAITSTGITLEGPYTMIILRRVGVFVIVMAGIVGGCAPDSKPQQKAEEGDQRAILNEGYSIFYSHISDLSLLHLIFLIKAESEQVNEMTREVTDYAGALKKTLEGVAKDYPAVNIELDPISAIEKRTSEAVTKDRLMSFAPIVGLTGESFDRRVLQSLEGVLNQLRFMCKVLAEEEPEPSLKQIWIDEQAQFERLYARVLGLLQEKYYINTGERKVKK